MEAYTEVLAPGIQSMLGGGHAASAEADYRLSTDGRRAPTYRRRGLALPGGKLPIKFGLGLDLGPNDSGLGPNAFGPGPEYIRA